MNIELSRVLVVAHEFSCLQGSECSEGWNISLELSKYCKVTVLASPGSQISQPDGMDYISAWQNAQNKNYKIDNLNVVFIKYPKISQFIISINKFISRNGKSPIGNPILYNLALMGWEKEVYKYIRVNRTKFDIVHRLTPISFSSVNGLHQVDIPYFWGPIGGMNILPLSFISGLNWKNYCLELVRNCSVILQKKYSRNLKKTVKNAVNIFTISADELDYVKSICPSKGISMIDTAPPLITVGKQRTWSRERKLKIVWSGSSELRKSLPILINAINDNKILSKISVTIIGNASTNPDWRSLSVELGVDHVIDWCGFMDYHSAISKMNECDLLIHTSIREAATAVILEALGSGLPIICHDVGGMGDTITEECGIKVPFVSPADSILGFREAINSIIEKPALIETLSIGAVKRAGELSWKEKVHTIITEYQKIHNN